MILFVDFEFNDYHGALISMALVDEEGDSWYRVLPCKNPSPWVGVNVVPVLSLPATYVEEFQDSLKEFLSRYDSVHIIADWPEDVQHFCAALITGLGDRLDTPPLTMEVRRDIDCDDSEVPHNALMDAIAGMKKYQKIVRSIG